tara:strand:- start:1898 stop:2794 length:897 start_codon:yes stop_codon:yes gene_type:complete
MMTKLTESKNVIFADTEEYDQQEAPGLKAVIDAELAKIGLKTVAIGSAHQPTAGMMSGDLDLQVELADIITVFKAEADPAKKKNVEAAARDALQSHLNNKGYQTARAGVNVFVRVPYKDKFYQIDLECIYKVSKVSRYHQHNIPAGSTYKGVGKQLMLAALAKENGYVYSAWEGLYARTADNKKGDLVADDWDEMAKILLGPTATGNDMDSVEAIMAKLPKPKAEELLAKVKADKNWQERPQNEDIARLRKLSGISENISITGTEKRNIEKKNNTQPGTEEWFKLWFSRPYLTGEKPE